MAQELSAQEIERAKFAFEIYDMDGANTVDACRLGDMLRALELNPTLKTIAKLGGTGRRGEKQFTLEEFLPIYADAKKDQDVGAIDDYVEILKLYDKDGNGYISANQLSHLLMGYGEKLEPDEVLEIMNECCDPCDEDGFTRWMPFLKRICAGPPEPPTLAAVIKSKEKKKDRIDPRATVVDEYNMTTIPSVSYSEAKPMNPDAQVVVDPEEEEEEPSTTFTLKKPPAAKPEEEGEEAPAVEAEAST